MAPSRSASPPPTAWGLSPPRCSPSRWTRRPAPPPAPSPPSPVTPPAPQHGYWLVGSDGGIFTFGAAQFYGSTGSLHLQRPVVGITPTANRGGYWLVASDGGIFAFGNAGYYGSIPGSGLNPAGSGLPRSLNAPIVGMVPSNDGGGYFMVASDGGVFAFGDARFEGSCPGIGGCSGAAVAVVPDATGNGYWVVTSTGAVYTFGDAVNDGQPGPQSSKITSAAATPNGGGYWILTAAGQVFPFGNAASLGGMPAGSAGGFDPASAIFATSDGGGYWIVTALGKVSSYGDAPQRRRHVGHASQRADRGRLRILSRRRPPPGPSTGARPADSNLWWSARTDPSGRDTWASSSGLTTSCRPRPTRLSTRPRSPMRCSISPTRRCSSRSPRSAGPWSISQRRRSAWNCSRSSSSTPSTTCRIRPSRPSPPGRRTWPRRRCRARRPPSSRSTRWSRSASSSTRRRRSSPRPSTSCRSASTTSVPRKRPSRPSTRRPRPSRRSTRARQGSRSPSTTPGHRCSGPRTRSPPCRRARAPSTSCSNPECSRTSAAAATTFRRNWTRSARTPRSTTSWLPSRRSSAPARPRARRAGRPRAGRRSRGVDAGHVVRPGECPRRSVPRRRPTGCRRPPAGNARHPPP